MFDHVEGRLTTEEGMEDRSMSKRYEDVRLGGRS